MNKKQTDAAGCRGRRLVNGHRALCALTAAGLLAGLALVSVQGLRAADRKFRLSPEHIAAVNAKRRIVVNHPADGLLAAIQRKVGIDDLMIYELGFTDEPGSQIDGQWWCLDKLFPMKARPMTARDSPLAKGHYMGGNVETIYRWADEGINIAMPGVPGGNQEAGDRVLLFLPDQRRHQSQRVRQGLCPGAPRLGGEGRMGKRQVEFCRSGSAGPQAENRPAGIGRGLRLRRPGGGLRARTEQPACRTDVGQPSSGEPVPSRPEGPHPEGGAAARPSFPGGGQDPAARHSGRLPFRRSGRGDLGSRQPGGHPGPGSAVL